MQKMQASVLPKRKNCFYLTKLIFRSNCAGVFYSVLVNPIRLLGESLIFSFLTKLYITYSSKINETFKSCSMSTSKEEMITVNYCPRPYLIRDKSNSLVAVRAHYKHE